MSDAVMIVLAWVLVGFVAAFCLVLRHRRIHSPEERQRLERQARHSAYEQEYIEWKKKRGMK